jgi:hypothetical protein
MILSTHALVGAVIGKNIESPWLIIILALIVHFIMDTFRHGEYVESTNPKTTFKNTLWKIVLDFSIGISIVGYFIFHNNPEAIQIRNIFLGVIFSIIPDFLTGLHWIFRFKFLKKLSYFHGYIVHRYPPLSPERKWTIRNAWNDIIFSTISIIILF